MPTIQEFVLLITIVYAGDSDRTQTFEYIQKSRDACIKEQNRVDNRASGGWRYGAMCLSRLVSATPDKYKGYTP